MGESESEADNDESNEDNFNGINEEQDELSAEHKEMDEEVPCMEDGENQRDAIHVGYN